MSRITTDTTRSLTHDSIRRLRMLMRPGVPEPLRERNFCLLFFARTISMFGSAIAPVALAFAVIHLTNSLTDLGLTMAAVMAPQVLFMLAGGIWADRLPRHFVMIIADVICGATQGFIGFLLLSGTAKVWHLIALSAVRGAASAFFLPAAAGIVPQTVNIRHLQQANALLRASTNATKIGGAAAGGLLVATAGAGWALVADAGSFFSGAALVALLVLPALDRPPRRRFLVELGEGWDEFRSRSWLWSIVAQFALLNVFGTGSFLVLGPFVSHDALGGAAAWGLILAAQGAGMVGGGLATLWYRPRRPLVVTSLAVLPMAAPLALFAVTAPVAAVAAAAFMSGFGLELSGVFWDTTLQQQIPEEKLSRVNSYDMVGSFAFIPLGLTVMGPLAEWLGVRSTLLGSAMVVVVTAFAVLGVQDVRTMRRLEPDTGPVPAPAS